MKKIIAIIATKNRFSLLNKAIQSVLLQTKQADEIIVTSDSSPDLQIQEQHLCQKYGLTFIKNQYAENYAGNLNTAIDYVVYSRMVNTHEGINHTFIAFLDDDDTWHSDYLATCSSHIKQNTDFIVTGLIYYDDKQKQQLSIPDKLSIYDFLEKNPHIQGSNTFIRLTTLLKAGCFDENMPSTTDRDLFVRVMMLNPKYEIIRQHLVNIDAPNSRCRLTNSKNGKKESLAKFYAKYGGLMDLETQQAFFRRANKFTSLSEQEISEILSVKPKKHLPVSVINAEVERRVVFAFIGIKPFFIKRLVNEIAKLELQNKKIVCVANFPGDKEEMRKFFTETDIPYSLITLKDIELLFNGKKERLSYIEPSCLKGGYIQDIATAKSILHFYAKQESKSGDIIWILDDDMEFFQNIMINGEITKKPLDIKTIILKYQNKYDVVVGSYSQDAPLPALSSLRTNLLDYVYQTILAKNQYYDDSIYNFRDYYYDLTNESHQHLETPVRTIGNCTLKDILSGKSAGRILFSKPLTEFEAYSRGGNTLIFNRDVLDIPNLSLTLADVVARRSDYFWVQQTKSRGYKIIGSTFSTFHNRDVSVFNYPKEIDKQIKDLIGSAFTKAYADIGNSSKTRFYSLFKSYYQERLVRIIVNYFRIIGLFEIIHDENCLAYFNEPNLADFIRLTKKYLDPSMVQSSFMQLCSKIRIHQYSLDISRYQKIIEKQFATLRTEVLGQGEEGIVFSDGNSVYKIFYERMDDETTQRNSFSEQCNELFNINIIQAAGYTVIRYPYFKGFQPYQGGFAIQLANLINFLKRKNLVLTNIKRENFIVINNQLKLVDYGKNIESYSPEKYQRSIERAYQMLKYPNLTSAEFKQMIFRSYLEPNGTAQFGIEHFKKILANRHKEQIHDPIIIELINRYNPFTVLDYGAGKCKIANALGKEVQVSVFDINKAQLEARANEYVTIIGDIESVNHQFDLINCNLVLCCIDELNIEYILNQVNRLLKDDGHFILSICHPHFDDIERTETRLRGNRQDYSLCSTYCKQTQFICRDEYHRPFVFYQRILQKKGFELIEIREDDGVNAESLNPISEHLIMVCRKVERPILHDCSLLIKTNPMEYQTIYKNVVHIIQQLEKQCLFSERIITVDGDTPNRVRRYSPDNRELLLRELDKLLANGYIDRIITTDNARLNNVYQKYFAKTADSAYAANGQSLFASLYGFDAVKTRYVFQTDSDILYHNSSVDGVQTAFNVLKEHQAVTLSLSICCESDVLSLSFGHRVEVRSSFIDLLKLNGLLPLTNPIRQEIFLLPWHRVLDNHLNPKDSIRLHQSDLFFVHPDNALKKTNLISVARCLLEQDNADFSHQKENVDLSGSISDWLEKTSQQMVLFVRGRNTPPEKLKRLFDSLKRQTIQNFKIIYIDDNSDELSSSYAEYLFKYDAFFKNKVISIFNDFRVGSLANFEIMYQHIVKKPNAIIVNIDNDDCLLKDNALAIIQEQFDLGADVTVGNCFRADKPLRRYQVDSFKASWQRNGDNIWLHPKCFRKYLCHYIQDNLLINDNYIDVATDYAIMLPIIQHAECPVFIQESIYYFDASEENKNKELQYKHATQMKSLLLQRAKQSSRRKIIAVIGDSNITEQSSTYHLAYELGKALVDNGFRVQTGGLGGVMEAAMKGAKSSYLAQRGDTIAIIPSSNETEVNNYADIVIPTGMDILRNGKVIQADAVIAIGGGAGTLSEIAMAWQQFKLIIAFRNIDGWSKQLADQVIDKRKRYDDIPNDRVYGVDNIEQALVLIRKLSECYTRVHHGIRFKKTNR